MAYIGNARSPLIFGPNTRDDIVPDGVSSVFTLSQEVPGGYESNIMVIRQKYTKRSLVSNTNALVFTHLPDVLSTTDQDLAAALSRVVPGDFLVISGTGISSTGTYPILSVDYDGTQIQIQVNGNLVPGDTGNTNIVLEHGIFLPWEVLEPDIDYTIGGVDPVYNRQINFTTAPLESEKIYVLHKGEATYNFVPTAGSVGPQQLQQNLRNFATDRFTGNGSNVNFLLSQEAVDSRSLIVTVNGVIVDGDSFGFSSGSWQLTESVPSSNVFDTVTFDVAPASGAAIRVLHLGFSTVSRRAAYSPSQTTYLPDTNSVGTPELKNGAVISSKLADGSVLKSKIANDAIDGDKILLDNNEAIRIKTSTATVHELIKLDASNNVKIDAPNSIEINATNSIEINAPVIPDSPVDLGSSTKRFNDIFSDGVLNTTGSINVDGTVTIDSGNVTSQSLTVNGNITISGTVDGVDVSALKTQVDGIIDLAFPPGSVVPFAGSVLPAGGWLWADGASYPIATYPSLHSVIGYTYGGAGISFNVPNLSMRFPIGFQQGGPLALGNTGGEFDHKHELPDHTHDDTHTHAVPGHNHENSVSLGSTLSVTTSGSHSTSLSHDHASFLTSSIEGGHEHFLGNVGQTTEATRKVFASNETLSASGLLVARNPNHQHSVSGASGNQSPNHTHTADTAVENDPAAPLHTHEVKTVAFENAGNLGASTNHHFVVGLPNVGSTVLRDLNTTEDGDHTHDFTVVTTTESVNHSHSISITTPISGEHDHVVRGTVPNTNSNHQHTIDVPNFIGNSSSNGEHVHPVSNVTGKIGKVTGGTSGDSNFNTGARSSTTTGQISSPGPGDTFSANPPYIVLRYIIKY